MVAAKQLPGKTLTFKESAPTTLYQQQTPHNAKHFSSDLSGITSCGNNSSMDLSLSSSTFDQRFVGQMNDSIHSTASHSVTRTSASKVKSRLEIENEEADVRGSILSGDKVAHYRIAGPSNLQKIKEDALYSAERKREPSPTKYVHMIFSLHAYVLLTLKYMCTLISYMYLYCFITFVESYLSMWSCLKK